VGALGEIRIDDSRQHFWDKTDGNADAKECGIRPITRSFARNAQDLDIPVSGTGLITSI
jgi:hypothetical protein